MNRSALFRKAARIFAKSDAPQGALLFQPMATPWENRPQKRIRPERAHSPARSIRKRGFLMGRQGFMFDNGSNPRRCHGLRVTYPFGAETLRLSLRVGMSGQGEGNGVGHGEPAKPPLTHPSPSPLSVRQPRPAGLRAGLRAGASAAPGRRGRPPLRAERIRARIPEGATRGRPTDAQRRLRRSP